MSPVGTIQEGEFRDRSRWLVLVGLAEILIAFLCGLIALVLPFFAIYLRQNPEIPGASGSGATTLNVAMFLSLAVLFAFLGVGTIRARRWARDLMLITAWIWLLTGVLTFALLILVVPGELSKQGFSGYEFLSRGELSLFMIVYAVVVGFAYIILPGMFILFYGGKNVRMTFETRDPVARWTGKCPLSVLTASQFLAGGAITLAVLSIYADELPFFGWAVTGIAMRLILIAAALLLGYLTWAVYKLRVHSWWVSFCFSVLTVGWLAGSRSKLDLARYVTGRRISFGLDDKVLSAVFVSLGIAWVIFLVYIKKHFKESPGRNAGVQPMRETR